MKLKNRKNEKKKKIYKGWKILYVIICLPGDPDSYLKSTSFASNETLLCFE
jgi:hypothetical protein